MDHDVRPAVRGGFNQVFRRNDREVAHFRQLLYRQLLITVRGVETCADGGCAKVHLQQQLRGAQNAFGLFIEQHIEGMELLAEGHRHRVLQLSAAHLEDVLEFYGFRLETFAQLLNRID